MNHRFARLGLSAFGAAFLFAPSPAQAACNALALCNCLVTATPVNFGDYDSFAVAPDDAAGTVVVECTLVVALGGSFTIDLSTGSSGSYSGRRLTKGASELSYNLYTDPARAQVWGDGTGGTGRITHSFSGLLSVLRTSTVYGRIPAQQSVSAGIYNDTIIVTVTY